MTTTKGQVSKNLEALKPEIEEIIRTSPPSVYLAVQALYQRTYGDIPSVGSVHKALASLGHTKTLHSYSQRQTTGRRTTTQGYIIILTDRGWVPEHVYVAQQAGWTIGPDDVVHHRNGDKQDNRLKNLEVMTRAEHASMHQRGLWQDPEYRERMTKKFKAAWAKRKLEKAVRKLNAERTNYDQLFA